MAHDVQPAGLAPGPVLPGHQLRVDPDRRPATTIHPGAGASNGARYLDRSPRTHTFPDHHSHAHPIPHRYPRTHGNA